MIFCGQALAEEPAIKIDNVVVTATRTDSTTDKIGGTSVTVLTKEDIAAQQQTSVKDVLKEVPGLDVVENGGPGTTANIFLRGADAKNTLILVDGVMFNDPSSTDRSANLANLTTDNIERI
jgi:vitamin B12 transporter